MSSHSFRSARVWGLRSSLILALAGVAGGARAEQPGAYVRSLFGDVERIDAESVFWDSNGRYFTVQSKGVPDVSPPHQWGVDTQTGAVYEIGLFGDGLHVANRGGGLFSWTTVTNTGWTSGVATRNDSGSDTSGSVSAWVANLATGVTRQVGLYDEDHLIITPPLEGETGPELRTYVSIPVSVTNSGFVMGLALNSTRPGAVPVFDEDMPDGLPFAMGSGQSIWIADATTNDSTQRYGLVDAAHTLQTVMEGPTTVIEGGYQASMFAGNLSESGFLAGYSMNFHYDEADGEVHAGASTWVGYAVTGGTYQVGLSDARHTNLTGTQSSRFVDVGIDCSCGSITAYLTPGAVVAAGGYVAGHTINYTEEGVAGLSAWVAGYDSGNPGYTTTRVGFFGGVEAGIYQSSDGREVSEITHFTESGLAGGYSEMLGLGGTGQSAWVVNAHTLVQTEVGLSGGGYAGEAGYRETYLDYLNDAGVATGTSTLFHQNGGNEDVAWVQKVGSSADGESVVAARIGLLTESDSINRSAIIDGLTEGGIIYGATGRVLAGGANVEDAWIAYKTGANYSSYMTDRVGLTDLAYAHPGSGNRASIVNEMNESGVALGASQRYRVVNSGTPQEAVESDDALWIASRQPGQAYVTTRVGLLDAAHTSATGKQESVWWNSDFGDGTSGRSLTNSGYTAGYSKSYGLEGAMGSSAWAVSADTGITRRIGLFGENHTQASTGIGYDGIGGITESGYVWGSSNRFDNMTSEYAGQASWLYSFSTDTVYDFDQLLGLGLHAISAIYGVTESGLAYGVFGAEGWGGGFQVFGWTLEGGVFVLENVVAAEPGLYADWGGLFVSESGEFIGLTADGDLFITTAVPEPATYAALAGVVVLGLVMVRRRRDGK